MDSKPGGLQSMGTQRVGHDWAPRNASMALMKLNIFIKLLLDALLYSL